MENSPYADAIVAARSVLIDPEEALAGNVTISLETQEEFSEQDVRAYFEDHFDSLIQILRYLSNEDQELLLSYYVLGKPQMLLAGIHRTTQTLCSNLIRKALARVGTYIMLGPLNEGLLAEVFSRCGLEDSLVKVPLSKAVMLYSRCRSFQTVAGMYGIHRPKIRRAMRTAAQKLEKSDDAKDKAISAYLEGLLEKASAAGAGITARQKAKQGHMYRCDPAILGEFSIRLEDSALAHVFMPRANN
jgi:hypothetical protein